MDRPSAGGPWFQAFHQIPDLPETLVRGHERPYLDWFFEACTATPGVPTTAAVEEYQRTYALPGRIASALGRYRGVPRQIAENGRLLSRPLDVPALAVGGDAVMGAAVADNLRHVAADVREEVFAGCGHFVTEERPAEVTALVLDFLRSPPPR